MAQTIQIKRGTGSAVPSGLADGELAINLDNGQLYFGSGSNSINDFTFNNITVNQLTSSIVTSSRIHSSGSNIFGDEATDTHTFIGNITASGRISASSFINCSQLRLDNNPVAAVSNDSLQIGTNTLPVTIKQTALSVGPGTAIGHITASGHISSSGNIIASNIQDIATTNSPTFAGLTLNPTGEGQVSIISSQAVDLKIATTHASTNRDVGIELSGSGAQYSLALDRANDTFVIAPSTVGDAPNNAVFELDATGNITASGNISSSGTIFTDEISSPSNNLIVSSSTVTITSTTDNEANLILESDTDNNDENDNPFMSFKQDGGAIAGMIGLSGDADKWPDGTTLTGVAGNAMIIGMTGSASSTNRQLYLAAGNSASLKIGNDADIHIYENLNVEKAITVAGTNVVDYGITNNNKLTFGTSNRDSIFIGTSFNVQTNVTASGNISSSGIITGKLGTTDTNVDANHYAVIQTAVNTVPLISNAFTVNPSTDLVDMSNAKIGTCKFEISSGTDGNYQGDVVFFGGTTSMTTGAIYHYKSDGTWELADADDNTKSDGLLGVALGAASDTNGVLLRGMVTLDHDPGAVGDPIYLTTTAGDASSTAPSGNGNIVRIIGYCLHATAGNIWFNPDSTFVEVNA